MGGGQFGPAFVTGQSDLLATSRFLTRASVKASGVLVLLLLMLVYLASFSGFFALGSAYQHNPEFHTAFAFCDASSTWYRVTSKKVHGRHNFKKSNLHLI